MLRNAFQSCMSEPFVQAMDHVQHEQQLVAVVDQLRRERVPIEAQVPCGTP